jgi:hypothetical protein
MPILLHHLSDDVHPHLARARLLFVPVETMNKFLGNSEAGVLTARASRVHKVFGVMGFTARVCVAISGRAQLQPQLQLMMLTAQVVNICSPKPVGRTSPN